jgi:hypothetical protein
MQANHPQQHRERDDQGQQLPRQQHQGFGIRRIHQANLRPRRASSNIFFVAAGVSLLHFP